MAMGPVKRVRAGVLEIAYVETGPADGPPVLLMHGFPYDIHTYSEVAPHGCAGLVSFNSYNIQNIARAMEPDSAENDAAGHSKFFTGPRSHRWVPGVGHNMPQEVPRVFADAVLELVPALRG